MIADFAVVHNGERVVGRTTPLSVYETEQRFGVGILEMFGGNAAAMSPMYWLMWRSLHLDADTSTDHGFRTWLKGLEEIQTDELPPPPG